MKKVMKLFCQPRVKVTSCFVYKVMGLTFYDRINTHLIYRFELAQVVARRITKPHRKFLGSNLTGCYFFYSFFYLFIRITVIVVHTSIGFITSSLNIPC